MPQNFNDIVSAALDEVLEFIGDSVFIGNERVNAVVNNIAFDQEFSDAGITLNRGISVVISSSHVVPAIGSAIIYKGRRYRIIEVTEDSAGTELVCGTDSK